MNKKTHWENVFATKQETEVSWYQRKPLASLQFFRDNAIDKDAKIIDVGGGDSYLIDHLLDMGYTNLYLLDISENAINRIRKRLGPKAEKVTFIVSDILDFKPEETFDVWHDRASFHFLTSAEDIVRYEQIVHQAVSENGYLFIGTFSENGPLKCSGLEITQYSEMKLQNVFKEHFETIQCFTEDHQTPFGTTQNFIFCTFKNKP
ncbi:class I SAM-dependent methyltransferase [Flavobacterium luminosum]|uniref:Class I SAM-dependent methyltransferase n=1 Tax=Flavobacterium luminosum TaxID=2949086 RepID=A0ABT0TRD9_9FLAO|nr:class I SAM-dependent methyltransferase [Flavobacterium sp. HXWNR70]MCL9810052.1 class I SAM-dependent methyltransferase [Flavobacterium sp. HXWNR70]